MTDHGEDGPADDITAFLCRLDDEATDEFVVDGTLLDEIVAIIRAHRDGGPK